MPTSPTSSTTPAALHTVSHRAAGGTHAENTLAGIQASLALGCEAIEIDVRATRDGHLVLMHDATLSRTTGDPRAVSDVTLEELRELSVVATTRGETTAPEPIPTLEEALHAIDGHAAIVVDFVVEEIADACVDLVNRVGAASWTWWTAHPPHLARRLAEACPGSRSFLGWTPRDGYAHSPEQALAIAERHGLAGLMASHRYIDEPATWHARRAGLAIYCWTVNEPRRMAQLIDLGVAGITTDYPATLKALLEHRSNRSAKIGREGR